MKEYGTVQSAKGRIVDVSSILHFSLPTVLEKGKRIAVDSRSGAVTLMTVEYILQKDEEVKIALPRQLGTVSLTDGELKIALPLFEYADRDPPVYCPHAILHSIHYFNDASEYHVAISQQRLYEAHEYGMVEEEIRPVRNAISRIRFKLKPLGLDVSSLMSRGYTLI